ncbi:MAG: protein-disulfide reductase DsbD domain-containing protein [Pseudomonadota bacterium]
MTQTSSELRTGIAVIAAAVLTIGSPQSQAQETWQETMGGRARLLVAGPLDPANLTATLAVEIDLKKGWKTYWRTPGDSGIPPEFDFSRSTNVADFEVLWPAPAAFSDLYGTSIGYTGDVVLPIKVSATNTVLPMAVDVTVRYGVCEKVCVPVEQTFSAVVTRFGSPDPEASALIDSALASVPIEIDAGTDAALDLAITDVRLDESDSGPALTIVSRSRNSKGQPSLFVEGPMDWYLQLPKVTAESEHQTTWTLPLQDLPDGTDPAGTMLTLTLVDGSHAIERKWRLD